MKTPGFVLTAEMRPTGTVAVTISSAPALVALGSLELPTVDMWKDLREILTRGSKFSECSIDSIPEAPKERIAVTNASPWTLLPKAPPRRPLPGKGEG